MKNIHKINQHIYITNSEEIKEETYFLEPINNSVLKLKDNSDKLIKSIFPTCKKIILTTDVVLIKDGVQAIDDEFLEWFVKNPSCEEVEVEDVYKTFLEGDKRSVSNFRNKYKIIIPKQSTKERIMSETSEETKQKAKDYGNSLVMKQTAVEWLEKELGKNPMPHGNRFFINKSIEKAKELEKQQQCYSKEEVLPLLVMLEKCKEYFLLKTDAKSEERADAIGQAIKDFNNLKI
jgi:hypothetical protein